VLYSHDPLLEEPLPPSSNDERFPVGLENRGVRFDLGFDVVLPEFYVSVVSLGLSISTGVFVPKTMSSLVNDRRMSDIVGLTDPAGRVCKC
jgi:hypothetical protein